MDGLRAIAALWVIGYDLAVANPGADLGAFGPLLHAGHTGVDLFMVLSGFCLFLPLAGPAPLRPATWKTFAIRRAWRILPPYYAGIAFALALPTLLSAGLDAFGATSGVPPVSWHQIWTHLLMLHTLQPDTFAGINPSFWSLGLETQFYLVFPLLALVLRRRGWRAWIAVLAGCGVWRWATYLWGMAAWPQGHYPIRYFILAKLIEFACGMGAASLVRRGAPLSWPDGADLVVGALSVAGLAFGYRAYLVLPLWTPVLDLAVGLSIGAVLLAVATPHSRLATLLGNPVLASIGAISYSFYLVDRPTCMALNEALLQATMVGGLPLDATGRLLIDLAAGVPLSLAIAWAFHRLFERPFLKGAPGWRWLGRRIEAPVVPAPGSTPVVPTPGSTPVVPTPGGTPVAPAPGTA